MGRIWCLKYPLKVWVDSETFAWEGFPDTEDLPVDYEIEYIRVWEKQDPTATIILLRVG